MIREMPSESELRPDSAIEDAARPGGHAASVEAVEVGEPTLKGAFSPEGVDLTVIRWMLRRTPAQRLAAAQQFIDAAWALRGDET